MLPVLHLTQDLVQRRKVHIWAGDLFYHKVLPYFKARHSCPAQDELLARAKIMLYEMSMGVVYRNGL